MAGKKLQAEAADVTDDLMRDAQRGRTVAGCFEEGTVHPDGMYMKPGSFDLPPSGWEAHQAAIQNSKRNATDKRGG